MSGYREAVIAAAPLAYWRLGERVGALAGDASGNQQTAAYKGGVTLARAGSLAADADLAVALDGSSGYVQAPSAVWFAGDLSIEAWVNPAAFGSYARILDFANGQGSNNVLLALSEFATGRPHFEVYQGSVSAGVVAAPQPLALGAWSHVVATLAGTAATLYVNGVAVASGTVGVPVGIVRTRNYLGRSNWGADAYAATALDEVALYGRALAADEVARHYALGTTPAPAPTVPGAVQLTVLVNGVPTDCVEAHTSHSVDAPVATCTLLMAAPRPAWVDLGATVTVQAGLGTDTAQIFSGRVPQDASAFDEQGAWLTVNCVGWASLLADPEYTDLTYGGGVAFKELFRSLCARRGVPAYLADDATYPDGATPIVLGGVPDVSNGDYVLPRSTDPLTELGQVAADFGYRVFDTPAGVVRLQRVSGMPPTTTTLADGTTANVGDVPARVFTEGVDAYRLGHTRDTGPMVTYWEVLGAKYTKAADGTQVAVRSIPASVPYSPLLAPAGYRHKQISDGRLVTQPLADACRNAQEIDYGAPAEHATWETDGRPSLQAGDVVDVEAPTLGVSGTRWLMALRQDVTAQGYYAQGDTWSGGGQSLAAGNDAVYTVLGLGPYHLGDETLAHYAHPAPDGTSKDFNFTVLDGYTAITLHAFAHGINSMVLDGEQTDVTLSKVELYQGGLDDAHRVGTTTLPVMPENLDQRLPYGAGAKYWTAFALPISGSLKAGPATLRFLSGSGANGNDDYEVENLTLAIAGVGQPTLPVAGDRT